MQYFDLNAFSIFPEFLMNHSFRPAFVSIEIECSVDEEDPSGRIIEVIERMSLVEDEKTNLDRVDVQEILEEYRKLNPIVVTGTTHRWKRQQERERNSEEELEVNQWHV